MIYLYLIIVFIRVLRSGKHEEKLIDEIFVTRKLNKYARPVENENDAVDVTFGISLQQIIDLDEKNEMLITTTWLDYEWHDYKLSWNLSDYGNVTSIRLPSKIIWTPDILMYNSADEDIDSKFSTNIVVYNDGKCSWVPPGIFISSCAIDITWFPFDDQICKMKFGSWTYDGSKINLTKKADVIDRSTYQESGEWLIVETPVTRNVIKYECCPEEYIDITFIIHIRRRALYYGFNIIVPCALISSLTMIMFLLPQDSGEKVSLGVTILLSLSVFSLIVADSVPTTSMSVPIVGVYFQTVMLMCTVSVVMAIFILNLHHRKPTMYIMPNWIRIVVCEWLAWILHMHRPGKDLSREFLLRKSKIRKLASQKPFSVSLISNITNMDNAIPQNDYLLYDTQANQAFKSHSTTESIIKKELLEILNEIRFITHKIKDGDQSDEEINDWKFAAMVIDRFCLITFTLMTIFTTLGCFMSVPHFS